MNEKKYFVLMKGGKDTTQVFHSKQPRGAALKAASRGETDISQGKEEQTVCTYSRVKKIWYRNQLAHQIGYLIKLIRQMSRKSA